ncbi:hypothetical protein ACWT_3383 [Actinoplanes sp. SE50]|uniref:hypothetical protein n=1 Tax=unclassified Actinoplanes TaxID=2626549 RepID=UPI00023ED230|nr:MULTISPECIES: hypothetical protein [unclassified Actinoplanes]AEV84406.1 hypothetical protein ACPL_3511 [Actinoplanes sp. SE50/110]ATO82798.1 hypothetical protein ACWT_3383 [Actinoplanes sp. SE50]SLM00206.1 hypothetical protein ACSP50_3438 [Actinoplanes sp. SE50/110]
MPWTTLVCLPADTPPSDYAVQAELRLARAGLTAAGLLRHFPAVTRWRRGSLLLPLRGAAAGGPVARLQLDAMREGVHRLHWFRWQAWRQTVAGTPTAKPYWMFLDRHRAAPHRYEFARARTDYLSQPRIAAMRVYNAMPYRPFDLPTSHLEALQLGAETYTHLGWLSAVPGRALLDPDGLLLAQPDDRLDARLTYLEQANRCLNLLGRRDVLVAAVTEPRERG